MRNRTPEQGFTLVELIIVIIILGILAALAIPQFTASTKDAKEASLKANLAMMRNAISRYYQEHEQHYPGALKEDGSGAEASGAESPAAFVNQLTLYTDKKGKTSATRDAVNYPYGPYLNVIPGNPLPKAGDDADGVWVDDDAFPITADARPLAWKFSRSTGEIIANNPSYASW